MNHQQLDRLLCERLGIAGEIDWVVGDENHLCFRGSEIACRQWEREHLAYCASNSYTTLSRKIYPRLSTTGEGMLTLMEALQADPESWFSLQIDLEATAGYVAAVFIPPIGSPSDPQLARSDSAPLALALAAAAALGIEVPE